MPIGRLVNRKLANKNLRGDPTVGKMRVISDYDDDVVKETKDDVAQIKKSLSASSRYGKLNQVNKNNLASEQEAGGRALTRTGSRAAAVGVSGVAAYEGASALNEAGRKKRDEEAKKSESKSEAPSKASEKKSEDAPAKKDMTFKEAFAAARKAGDDTFSWNGKKYTTEMKGEDKPKPSVREGKNENIDDETREKAQKFNKGGMVKGKTFTGIRRC